MALEVWQSAGDRWPEGHAVVLTVQAGEVMVWSSVTGCLTGPDQAAPRVIDHLRMRIEELLLEIVQPGIVELELPLEGAVGQASTPLEHRYGLIEDLLKGHCPPSLSR